MPMLSCSTIGAMASKKESASSPVSALIAAPNEGEVNGPVATITEDQPAGGKPSSSPRSMRIFGCAVSFSDTSAEKASRSTASAPPAGSLWCSATCMMSEPARRISSWSRPTAFVSKSSERKEFEQTSSAQPPVLCASVSRPGRISCRIT